MDERVVPLTIELHPPGVRAKSCCEPKFNEITFYLNFFLILAIIIPEILSECAIKMCTHMHE